MPSITFRNKGKDLGIYGLKERSNHEDREQVAKENGIEDFDEFILDAGRVWCQRMDLNGSVWLDHHGKAWLTTHDPDTTYQVLHKTDMVSLVKGTVPNYDIMDKDLVKKTGHYIGGHHDKWSWDQSSLEKLTKGELWWLYQLCKSSWKR